MLKLGGAQLHVFLARAQPLCRLPWVFPKPPSWQRKGPLLFLQAPAHLQGWAGLTGVGAAPPTSLTFLEYGFPQAGLGLMLFPNPPRVQRTRCALSPY